MKIYCSRSDDILTKLCGKDLYVLIYNIRKNRQGWYKITNVLDCKVVVTELFKSYVTDGYFYAKQVLPFEDIIVYDEICTEDEVKDQLN